MRGIRPNATIGRAKKFAERQGYRWVPNPEADMPFDALVYRGNDMIVVRIRTNQTTPGEYHCFKDFFNEEILILNSLPFPSYLPREIWVRYPGDRTFCRFRIFGNRFLEIAMTNRVKPSFERLAGAGSSPWIPLVPGNGGK